MIFRNCWRVEKWDGNYDDVNVKRIRILCNMFFFGLDVIENVVLVFYVNGYSLFLMFKYLKKDLIYGVILN